MVHSRPLDVSVIRRRGALILAALATSVCLFTALVAGPVPQARAEGAEYFCYYLAKPYGQSGDRCYASTGHYLRLVRSFGYNHSACSDAWKEEKLVTNWACAPTETWSNSYFDGTRDILAVIRNNTTGANNQIWGYQEWN
jgi:hypothetical protein